MSHHNFLAWLLEDVNALYAEKDSPRDQQLREFAAEGWLEQVDDQSGDSVFIFTNKLVKELDRLREVIAPLSRLELPKKPQGNAGLYSIFHKDIEAAKAALSQ